MSEAAHPAITDAAERVEVWRGAGDRWRWRYRSGDVVLAGNEDFADVDSARRAATTAYPGVDVRDVGPAPDQERRRRSVRFSRREGVRIVVIAAALAAVVVLARRRSAGSP